MGKGMKTLLGIDIYRAHILVWIFFAATYALLGMKEHFGAPSHTMNDISFYTTMVHSTIGFGDLQPKTAIAKVLTTAHVAIVIVLTLHFLS